MYMISNISIYPIILPFLNAVPSFKNHGLYHLRERSSAAQEGTPIGALELFASLVEHMARWAEAVEDSFGLCMLEAAGAGDDINWMALPGKKTQPGSLTHINIAIDYMAQSKY